VKTTIFFATDVHGSEACWRKFVNSGKHYEADVLILGGDMTGKAIVPVVGDGGGRYHFSMQDQRHDIEGDEDLAQAERLIQNHGYYPVHMSSEEVREYTDHPEGLDAVFEREMLHTVERWMAFADERLAGSGIHASSAGNDDSHEIDPIIDARPPSPSARQRSRSPGGTSSCRRLDEPTPWATHREEDEPAQGEIEAVIKQARVGRSAWCWASTCRRTTPCSTCSQDRLGNTHGAGQDVAHVGSTAVRRSSTSAAVVVAARTSTESRRHPHGAHPCGQPGQHVREGTLSGFLVQLDGKDKIKHYRLTSG
jgi:Icc-related predicted phosphoesterase